MTSREQGPRQGDGILSLGRPQKSQKKKVNQASLQGMQ